MNVVVGANGFLGSRLVKALSAHGQVIRVGRRGGEPNTLQMDLKDNSALDALVSIANGKTLYYCANVGGRDAAAADPISAYRINVAVPARLASVARRLIYFSSDYVFSQPGQMTDVSSPTPDSVYAELKAKGERAVLAASATALVVRVSGLYDENGTRAGFFCDATQVIAPDDRVTSPTYVPDLITTVLAWQDTGQCGIRHAIGPEALSLYEFYQLASLQWGFDVRPTLSLQPRWRTVLQPSNDVKIRRPADIFAVRPATLRQSSYHGSVLVVDCVGVVLSGRRWREPNIRFWDDVEADAKYAVSTLGAERVADAYCPNPRFWQALRRDEFRGTLVLTNNGPWESFSRWCDKYGFTNLFDMVINSEMDGLTKPEAPFRDYIINYADGRPVRLVDDRETIVKQASQWGWDSSRTTRVSAWPIEEYAYERRILNGRP